MIRVLVVDDHAMVRVGLERLLATYDDIEFVGAANSGELALELVASTAPDVVLMDMSLGGIDGPEATRQLRAVHPSVKVIALSTFDAPERVASALSAGASGYLLKTVETEVLVAGIRSVLNGGAPLSPSIAADLIRGGWQLSQDPVDLLTHREVQVLRLILAGNTNKQIGGLLGVCEKTVKSHCSHLFRRLGVANRTQAALWAERNLPEDRRKIEPLGG